jgi:hypothetical protein
MADVRRAADVAGFVEAVDAALAADAPERRRERSHRARAHSWEARLQEIDGALDTALVGDPR